MKILLRSPFHPSLYIYLMEVMPQHEWYVDKDDWEGDFPKSHLKYKVLGSETPDVQIVNLHENGEIDEKIPIVLLEYWKLRTFPKLEKKWPLVYTSKTSHNNYPNMQYWCPEPSKVIWNDPWVGDVEKILVLHDGTYNKLLSQIGKWKLPLEVIRYNRSIPFDVWKYKLKHYRAVVELSHKHSSLVLLECRHIGTPAMTFDTGCDKMTYTFSGPDPGLRHILEECLNSMSSFGSNWWSHYPEINTPTEEVWNNALIQSLYNICQDCNIKFTSELRLKQNLSSPLRGR